MNRVIILSINGKIEHICQTQHEAAGILNVSDMTVTNALRKNAVSPDDKQTAIKGKILRKLTGKTPLKVGKVVPYKAHLYSPPEILKLSKNGRVIKVTNDKQPRNVIVCCSTNNSTTLF